ncbi:DUF4259 domain-containing protein [Corynebacterium aquatimens]|uniref:DUF4259 domain-containing protein n=1 Tax=Corynebacterium TaxID=1716 RepID=UPI001F2E3D49|nr:MULTISPECIES: DUF4259 domain-containing protein [Corynebacterium]QYH20149.1 DUF4259 domain-containing protein [Corynebacterium aquatimens]UIZ92618.1 DUF4259 domain-containing protein [Corynebacterium sp. CNCTC7651]
MSTWETEIFSAEENADFLDDLAELEPEEILEAVRDAVLLASDGASPSEEERLNGLAAATIAAIWSGAPFSAGEIAETYPFIRSNPGDISEKLAEAAVSVLENADANGDTDVDQFIEALS